MEINELTKIIIGASIEVHRTLGPGLLESVYEECLCRELSLQNISFERQRAIPLEYKGVKLECGYRLDLLVENKVVVEIKSVETLLPINEAQVLTYLKLGGWQVALLINFNVSGFEKRNKKNCIRIKGIIIIISLRTLCLCGDY